jgi:hypothetical protein
MTESLPEVDLPDERTADEHQTEFVPFSLLTTKPPDRAVEDKYSTRATSAEDVLRDSGLVRDEAQNHQRISGRMGAAALTTEQLIAVDLYLRDLDDGR